ncbi:hypothetical protein JNB84_22545 [Rhizobium pusense]|uniref:hypothetical protein n=1 Tax=Agrobacterium pusense TaxID=648995 RepID=UPI001C6F419E|nr:hypothetical protein [Agrobacterium pusense]MBW9080745.1 hypothetical protein [Agrobacterium pusense]
MLHTGIGGFRLDLHRFCAAGGASKQICNKTQQVRTRYCNGNGKNDPVRVEQGAPFMPTSTSPDPQVVICLENATLAARVRMALGQHGLAAMDVSPSAMLTGRPFPHCRVVITYTSMVGRIRTLMDLPIINFETFIFELGDGTTTTPRRRFDSAAFLKRVLDLIDTKHRLVAE